MDISSTVSFGLNIDSSMMRECNDRRSFKHFDNKYCLKYEIETNANEERHTCVSSSMVGKLSVTEALLNTRLYSSEDILVTVTKGFGKLT